MANVMKMAFVINGVLNQSFATSIGRVQKQMASLQTYIDKLNERGRQQKNLYLKGAISLQEYEASIARIGEKAEIASAKIQKLQTAMTK